MPTQHHPQRVASPAAGVRGRSSARPYCTRTENSQLASLSLRTALAALTPAAPMLAFSDLCPLAAKRLANLLGLPDLKRDHAELALKVTGLGKGPHAHRVSRPDLVAFASADVAITQAAHLARWYRTSFPEQRLLMIPDELRATAAVRAVWSVGRAALRIDSIRAALPRSEARCAPLERSVQTLAEIASPWVCALPAYVTEHTFACHEVAFDAVTGDSRDGRSMGICSGSALVSDVRYQRVIEASVRPAWTVSAIGAQIAHWMDALEVTTRVLGLTLQKAGVALADPARVYEVACQSYDTAVWAAAALALFPSQETLALSRAPTASSRTRAALAWSAAQIESTVCSTTPPLPHTKVVRTRLRLEFDAETVECAVRLFRRRCDA